MLLLWSLLLLLLQFTPPLLYGGGGVYAAKTWEELQDGAGTADSDVFYIHTPLDADLADGAAEETTSQSCGKDQFYCDHDKGGKCIPNKWVCDQEFDCNDRTDENEKCPTRTCGPGQFHCRLTGICIPMGYRCDREVDCGFTIAGVHDRSDEDDAHCNLTLNCPANQHKCLTVDSCVPLAKFCDKIPQCPDLSDEGPFCNENYNITCKYSWKPTPDLGARCYCPNGKRPKGAECVDDDECSIEREGGFSPCDQLCTNYKGGYNCSCVPGYKLNGKSECVAQNVPPNEIVTFLIANGEAAVHIDANLTKTIAKVDGKLIQALDFDHRNRSACWVVTVGKEPRQERHVLQCASIDRFDRNHTWFFDADYSLEGVEQMAKDWVSGNWYFIDDSYDRLFVCNWNVSICRTLLAGVLDKPKDMALDPSVGYIFVTDWSSLQPGLIRLNMDGENMTRLVNLSIIYPYGLTLDYPKRMVFWLDNYLEYIHGIDYEGMYKRRVVASGHLIKTFYSITTFEKYLYASDYFKPAIFRITKTNGTNSKEFRGGRDLQKAYTIRAFHRQRQPDLIHPCGTKNGGCEHLCLVRYLDRPPAASGNTTTTTKASDRIRAAKCACRDGYRLEAHGRCVLALKYPFILFGKTAPGTLLGIPLRPPKAGYFTISPVRHLQRPTALAVVVADGEMYFSDAANFTIQKRKIAESMKSEVVIDEGISNCEGLAVDWMARNLYWSDEGLLTVNVARLDDPRTLRRVIARGNMSHPRAIAVHPKVGYVFWTDWADLSDISAGRWVAKIERANLNGGDRRALVSSHVHWPNGLAIDYGAESKIDSGGWLYWCDAYMDQIARVRFDGSDRQVIVDSQHVAHPYGLAYYEGYLYWTEFRKGLILRVHVNEYAPKSSSQKEKPPPVEMFEDSSPLFEVHIFDDKGQRDRNLCSIKNGGCQHFCFYNGSVAACECADGFRPISADPKQCERDPGYETKRRCLDTQFECKRNHRCIDLTYVCDSDNDCKDFSDEDTGPGGPCENHTCSDGQFQCKSNRCIPKAWVCDGDRDCPQDGEDEANCSVSDCGLNKFRCKVSKKCILSDWVCDHEFDCGPGDFSDEHENCSYPKCRNDQFECHNKQCIPVTYVCDGDRDCRDGSDEMHCDINCIQGQEFRCTQQSPCISVYRKCDGYLDCADGTDELDCVRNAMNCTKNQFQCVTSGECIRSIFRCDGDADCADASDEIGCPKLNCPPLSHFECRDGSRCIVRQWLCDGYNDCVDNSDETNCTVINPSLNKCVSPNFPCKNDTSACLVPRQLCDGHADCPDASDEGLRCGDKMCRYNETLCGETCYNSPDGFFCACETKNYKLQPDGRTCSAQDPCGKWGVCSQHCQSTGSHYFCWCDKGYELSPVDKFTCKSVGSTKPYIIFSNRHELRMVGLRDGVTTSLAVNLRNTIAIDYYYEDETKSLVFWTDIATDKIYGGTLENFALSDVRIIVEHGIATAEGIAVDWIGQNLYWVDSSLDQIEVAKFDGRWRATVVSGQMQNLRAIAVDPRKGLMFWTDWEESNPRIERCTLAGNERVHNLFPVISVQGGGWPNGLTADYIAERLYWIDAKSDSIHTITYEGKDHRQVLRGHDFLSHPFAIAIFEDKMYWTDWRVNSIVRANKWNGSDVQIIQGTSAQPFDIQIIHPSRQPRRDKNPCVPGNGGCSHLCLLNSNVTGVCKCPYLMKLSADNKTCEELDRALLFVQPMAITGVDLEQPYVNVIPVLASAVVENVSAVDVDTSTRMIYWTDIKAGAIRRSYLNGSDMQVVIDSGLPNPYGLAVDWLSGNLYFTSYASASADTASSSFAHAKISVSSLNGEFRKVLIRRGYNQSGENEGLRKPSSIVVDPARGYMYWIDSGKKPPSIEYAFLDGSDQRYLPTSSLSIVDPTSLSIDYQSNRLYWTDRVTHFVYYCDLTKTTCGTINLPRTVKPSAIAIGRGKLYYYDESAPQESYIGALDIIGISGGLSGQIVYVRNKTSRVRNLKVFDPKLQTGDNGCRNTTLYRPCSQLCLPLPGYKKGCACATGYQASVDDSNRCEGKTKFVLYADSSTIGGLDEAHEAAGVDLLAPLSQVQHPTSLDFHAAQERIYWADMDANRIVSVRRDLTNRTVIIDDPGAKVHSIVVDWIAENIYWTNRQAGTENGGVIEVARLNGTHRRIVVHETNDAPRSLQIDPRSGFLFWLNNTGVQRAYLDGSQRVQIVAATNITDLAVDLHTELVCWLNSQRSSVACVDYDGSKYRSVFNSSTANSYLTAFTVNGDRMYWSDKNVQQGSIMMSVIGDDGIVRKHIQLIKVRMQTTVNDLRVFDRQAQMGTNPCERNNGGCEHLCLYRGFERGHTCACSFAKLNADEKTCSPYDAFIVYSRVQRIDFAHLSENIDDDPNTPFPSIDSRAYVRNVIGLAYDYENRRLFYSDIQLGSVMAAEFRSANKSHQVYEIATNQGSIEGLAYDYVHQDLYWTSYSNASINRASVRPGVHPVEPQIVLQLASIDKPRGIVVDPCEMQIYWTNWNEAKPSIERSYLSGAMRQTVVNTDVKTPNALTIDFYARKLYWSDARLDKIERCELDGSHRVVISSGLPSHVFGMAVYGDYLYWTDWIMRAVVRVNKFTGGDFAYVKRNFTRQPMGIIVVANDSATCDVDACAGGHSAFCQDICSLDAFGRPKCECRPNRVLQADNATCLDVAPTCDSKTTFQCESGRCIPYEFTCDGSKECPNGDDELPAYCANRKCRDGYFRCKNGQCVNASSVCDGINTCGDYSDEFPCPCNKTTQFRCQSGMCVPLSQVCNDQPNCNDASDEIGCPKRNCSAMSSIIGRQMINCNFTTQCILPSWICDGHNDCWDNGDERNCADKYSPATVECLPSMFQCANSKRCIPAVWRCNGEKDCSDESDEKHCEEKTCLSKLEFQCKDKVCILSSWTCDGTPDCSSGEDEDESLCKGREAGDSKTCSGSHFLCSNGQCIPHRWVCDGENDCNDTATGSDETNCKGTNLCPQNYFQCKNGQCILSTFYCDREDDCGDNSDEPQECLYHSCDRETQFQCKNGHCIPSTWTCNGIFDCKDHSDEDKQLCELKGNNATLCKSDEYQCQNRVCIDEDLVCDSHNDCGDWSDEGPLCNQDECAHMNNPCDHICKDKKQGYICLCHEGYELAADKRSCVDLDECAETLPCSQICLNRPGSYSCACRTGYTLQADGKKCKQSTSVVADLVVSNRYYIWRYTMDGRSKGHVLNNLTNAVAVDYDWVEERVYWSDVTSSSSRIGRVFFNGTGWEVLHVHTVRNPDGLAVDWAGRNLYWCDKGVDTIEVSRLDGRFRKVLMRQQFLQEPRAIVVDPHSRLLFWSDWGENAHIGRMGMDGSSPRLIVDKSLKWPNALTVDYITKKIFWGDAGQDYIGMSDYDGSHVRVVTTEVNHIFSIALFEDYLYWTDWETGRIERAHKYTGKSRAVIVPHLEHRPMGIRVVHPLLQPKLEYFNNPCANGGWCSNLCLLSPASQGRTCACPEGFKVKGRLECVPNCKPSEFVCENTYKCLPLWWRCDGQDDCGDGQDELYFKPGACPPFNCTAGEFQCLDGAKCVQPSRICDGNPDCPDESDEGKKKLIDCETYQCISGQWKCPNSSVCISEIRRCDGRRDCPNGDDELDCLQIACPPSHFRCSTKGPGSRMCLPRVFFCDSELDCPNGSDEPPNCRNRTCSDREFKCPGGRCIPISSRCDGDQDCKNGEDELNCLNSTCDHSYFRCGDGRCVPLGWRCDSEPDCSDGSDEHQCNDALNCTSNEFRCADGRRCIARSLLCNGRRDCVDGSDEDESAGCSKTSTCHQTQFACANKRQCIPLSWKCDGEVDCFDGSDEFGNCTTSCNSSQFQCASNKRCINALFQCDGQFDCEDATDENLVRCMVRPCPPGFYKCNNGKCFPAHLRCDGVRHCQDGSDETECLRTCEFSCDNGRCIKKEYLCDSYDDCGDGSDETKERCSPDPCRQFGVCSQKCTLDRNTRHHKCYCDDGFAPEPKNRISCKAIDNDPPPILLLAGEQEIRYLNIRNNRHFDAIPMPGDRLHALAASLQRSKPKSKSTPAAAGAADLNFAIYWTDVHNGAVKFRHIQSLEIAQRKNNNRGRRSSSTLKSDVPSPPFVVVNDTLVPDCSQPRGIALDYLHGNLYWADSGHETIGVMNLNSETREYRNLISWNLDAPYAIAVAPEDGILFWTDVGPRRKIESSSLDGSGRRLLVNKDLVYPTGLAVDQPNGRLYWADPKTSSIETISFDGTDRRLVKTFPFGSRKPMYLDVFEDTIFFTTYINHEVLSMSKFGNDTVTQLMDSLPYPANLIVWHSSREKQGESACSKNPCPSDALCLPGADPMVNYTCLCGRNKAYKKDVNTCLVSTLPHIGACPLLCYNGGQCVVETPGRKLKCQCQPGYAGETCQDDICYGLCLNGGTCTINDLMATASCSCPIEYTGDRCQIYKCAGRCRTEHGDCYIEKDTESPKCRCHTGWAGEQCDTPSSICNNHCYNNGTCYVLSGNKAQCKCPITHRGERCEQCYELHCMHDGVCMQNRCICKLGYEGRQCEVDICEGYCANGAVCSRKSDGPKCKCSPRFTGDKCQKDRCRDLCKNGGFCRESDTGVYCLCPSRFAGPHCESAVNCSDYCLNGAECDVAGNDYLCRCSIGFNGTRCENELACSDYCDNGARCSLNARNEPICHCPTGLAGPRCQDVAANSCGELRCLNNGQCEEPFKEDVESYTNPVCTCKPGWTGLVCNLPDCEGYCLNDGACVIERSEAACRCVRGYYGNQCEHKFVSKVGGFSSDDDIPGTVSAVVIPLVLVMLLGMLIFYVIFVRRRKPLNQFKHSRMHDVDEVQNPVFLRGGDDDDLDALVSPSAEESTTFTNPMYDSVYNDTVTREGAAGSGLLTGSSAFSPAESNEELGLLGAKSRLEINQD